MKKILTILLIFFNIYAQAAKRINLIKNVNGKSIRESYKCYNDIKNIEDAKIDPRTKDKNVEFNVPGLDCNGAAVKENEIIN